MSRKRSSETSPIYGSLLVSMLYRSIEFMATGGKDSQSAETLDNVLGSIFDVPEIQDWAAMLLDRVSSMPATEWRHQVRRFINVNLQMVSRVFEEEGQPDPLEGLTENQKIKFYLDLMGREESLALFSSFLREQIIDLLNLVVFGEKQALAEWTNDITSDLFKGDPEKAVTIIRMALIGGGGNELLEEIDDAVIRVRKSLGSSLMFNTAVELVEKDQEWGGFSADSKFKESWESLKSRVMGRIKGKSLTLPEEDIFYELGEKKWDEEETLAMITVFNELKRRAGETPVKLVSDAWEGKLSNSIVVSIENDVKDEIRKQKAKKRGFDKREEFSEQSLVESGRLYPKAAIDFKEPLQSLIEKYEHGQLCDLLSEEERAIVELILEGYKEREIGNKVGKSQAWVSGKLKNIRQKLSSYKE